MNTNYLDMGRRVLRYTGLATGVIPDNSKTKCLENQYREAREGEERRVLDNRKSILEEAESTVDAYNTEVERLVDDIEAMYINGFQATADELIEQYNFLKSEHSDWEQGIRERNRKNGDEMRNVPQQSHMLELERQIQQSKKTSRYRMSIRRLATAAGLGVIAGIAATAAVPGAA